MGSALLIALTPAPPHRLQPRAWHFGADLENEGKILSVGNFKLLQLTLRFHWQESEECLHLPPAQAGRSGFQEPLPSAWHSFTGVRKKGEAGRS